MKKLMLCLLGILLLGCSTRLGDFTVLSTRNVEIGGDYILVERNVEGEDVVPIIIFFPLGIPNLENAIDDALKSVGGDLITDAVLKYNYWYIPYIGGIQRYSVEGDVWVKLSDKASLKLEEFSKNPDTMFITAIEDDGKLKFIEKNN